MTHFFIINLKNSSFTDYIVSKLDLAQNIALDTRMLEYRS